jgi:hypothetical protein
MSRIKDAHQWCQDSVREKLTKGYGVVVSNTFTTQKEMKPYFDMAKEFGIRPQVILCQGNYGNIHNVPTDVLARMAERFEYDLFELWIGLDL